MTYIITIWCPDIGDCRQFTLENVNIDDQAAFANAVESCRQSMLNHLGEAKDAKQPA